MTLPQKGTRRITVDGEAYRWVVSVRRGAIRVAVEHAEVPGQRLDAYFECHDTYTRDASGDWRFKSQGRSIKPRIVQQLIREALRRGWQPTQRGLKPLMINDTHRVFSAPEAPPSSRDREDVRIKDVASEHISDLMFDVSLDPKWRSKLLNATVQQRFELPEDYVASLDRSLSERVHGYGLRFAVFNDGFTDDGWFVIGIECTQFKDVVMFSTNNPAVWCDES